jgi:hypothetical protein
MKDLIEKPRGRKGRRQTHTAKAWVERPTSKHHFISRVSLGKGRIYDRSTGTTRREIALAFNRAHLLELLTPKQKPTALPPTQQLDFLSPP